MPEHPRAADFPSLDEPAFRLVTALRLVCGGSVVATRPIHARHDNEILGDVGGTAVLNSFGAADASRPTVLLSGDHVQGVRGVYERLANPAVGQDHSLQVALRRFVFAGSRALPEDRLIDLHISSEALFIKRRGVTGSRKGAPAARAARDMLAGDPALGIDGAQIERFVAGAYRLRNAEIHGDPPAARTMTLLSGAETDHLAPLVEDLAFVVGRAIAVVLDELTSS